MLSIDECSIFSIRHNVIVGGGGHQDIVMGPYDCTVNFRFREFTVGRGSSAYPRDVVFFGVIANSDRRKNQNIKISKQKPKNHNKTKKPQKTKKTKNTKQNNYTCKDARFLNCCTLSASRSDPSSFKYDSHSFSDSKTPCINFFCVSDGK